MYLQMFRAIVAGVATYVIVAIKRMEEKENER
jgi:hypothetical protein